MSHLPQTKRAAPLALLRTDRVAWKGSRGLCESPDHGNLVNVELCVDGISLTTGHGLPDAPDRDAIAEARSRGFVGSMEPEGFIHDLIWSAPGRGARDPVPGACQPAQIGRAHV